MAEFFRSSTTWVIDFLYQGRPRRWFKVFREGLDPSEQVCEQLRALYGDRAQVQQVRVATAEEESQYLRGEEFKPSYCAADRPPRVRR